MNLLDMKDDIVVFDLDGVLARYNFGELGRKMYGEHEWVAMNMELDMYAYIQRTHLFDHFIHENNPDDMYVLSTAFSSFEQANKIEFISREYSNIKKEKIYFVSRDEYKIDVLKELRNIYDNMGKTDKRIVFIEDSAKILGTVEDLQDPRIKCFLVSDFI